jgi:hypothetical protein
MTGEGVFMGRAGMRLLLREVLKSTTKDAKKRMEQKSFISSFIEKYKGGSKINRGGC